MLRLIRAKSNVPSIPKTEQDSNALSPARASVLSSHRPPLRILVANSKGGCGKTTLSTNLAGAYAANDFNTVLIDFDMQASSRGWHLQRRETQAPIHFIGDYDREKFTTRSYHLHPPRGSERIILDSPAASIASLDDLIHRCDVILIPVLPSPIDIRAATGFIREILLHPGYRQSPRRLGIIANRVRKNTLVYEKLQRFLQALQIPLVATFRDSQWYVRTSEQGSSICEFRYQRLKQEQEEWARLINWLEKQAIAIHNQRMRPEH